MKVYHGTNKKNAKKILRDGFKLPKKSQELWHGLGVYFTKARRGAEMYGDTVLEVDIPDDVICWSKGEGAIGVYGIFANGECTNGETKKIRDDCCMNKPDCFDRYIQLAEEQRRMQLARGCPAIRYGSQVVAFDDDLISMLKPKKVK